MYLDAKLEFSDSQALTASGLSEKIVDLGTEEPGDVGAGEPMWFVVTCDEGFSGITSLGVALESAATDALSDSTVHVEKTAAAADLVGGETVLAVGLPADEYGRYLGVRYTVEGAPTAGAVSAFLTKDPQAWRAVKANTR